MSTNFLDKAYTSRDTDSTRDLYNDWSATYEAEVGAQGYATPARCAEALAAFEVIDGVDISPEMLAQARAKDVYRNLTQIEPDTSPKGGYSLISAVGVIGAGAAPISILDTLLHALPSQGKLVFSFNDHALADHSNTGRLNEWLDCGAARLLFMEHGPHLPGHDLKSYVYVIEKA